MFSYVVQMPMDAESAVRWFTVCTCGTAHAAGEVVRAIMDSGGNGSLTVKVERIWTFKE